MNGESPLRAGPTSVSPGYTPTSERESPNDGRRNLLKTLVAGGAVGTGAFAFSGSAAAQGNLKIPLDCVEVTNKAEGVVGTFDGTLHPKELTSTGPGELLASGRLRGTLDGDRVNQQFTDTVLSIIGTAGNGECPILFLELGPLDLDLLGLQVSLSQITLDIMPSPVRATCSATCCVPSRVCSTTSDRRQAGSIT